MPCFINRHKVKTKKSKLQNKRILFCIFWIRAFGLMDNFSTATFPKKKSNQNIFLRYDNGEIKVWDLRQLNQVWETHLGK